MARTFNGSNQYGSLAKSYLAGADAFTINHWIKPSTSSGSRVGVAGSGVAGNYWQIDYTPTGRLAGFYSVGYSGSDPSSLGVALDSDVNDVGAWVAWRHTSYNGEWSQWVNGVKTVVSASLTFALPITSASLELARILTSFYFSGTLAEFAMWQSGLSDEQIMELHRGVAADVVAPGGLLGYWPLRGNSSPELNYAVASDVITLSNAPTTATHPTIVPPKLANVVEPVWVVDIRHPDGTIRAASTDCYSHIDTDILGTFYPGLLADDITVSRATPDTGAGVIVPDDTTLTLHNTSGTISGTAEYRQVPVTVRHYDRASHALGSEFSGVITAAQIDSVRATFPCTSMDDAVLSQLVPRVLIEIAGTAGLIDDVEGNALRTDVGVPIPVPMGTCLVSMPAIGGGTAATDFGSDYLAGYRTQTQVKRVFWDKDQNAAGLETGTTWDTEVPAQFGAFTSIAGTTFGLPAAGTIGATYTFFPGRPVRYTSPAGVTSYTHVASFAGTIVTVAGSVLPTAPAAFGTVALGNEYLVEDDRYKFVYPGGTAWLKTVRFPSGLDANPIAEVADRDYTNPATCIAYVLNDPVIGLGQSVDLAALTDAAAAVASAGLNEAVAGAMGANRTQRPARDVIDELALMRGMRVWFDADSESWKIEADSEPADAALTFEFGPDTRNNISAVEEITRTPLEQCVSTLRLRYGAGGRARPGTALEVVDYAYSATTTALGVGGELTIQSPWLRNHIAAARVAYYLAKRIARSDQRVVFTTRHEGRRVALGDLVTLNISVDGMVVSGDYRIVARQRALTEFRFVAVGPYNADIYETDQATITAAVNSPSGDVNPDERARGGVNDANLLANPDFSTKTRTSTFTVSSPDATILPGWAVEYAHITGLSVTQSQLAKGGFYCEMTTGGTATAASFYSTSDGTAGVLGALACLPDTNYIASIYCSRHPRDWQLEFTFRNSSNISVLGTVVPLRAVPGDVNGLQDVRYYGLCRAPSTARSMFVRFIMSTTNTTYRWDAAQVEEMTRLSLRPTPWHRNIAYGIQPTQIAEGNATFRPAAFTKTTEHGTQIGHTTAGTAGVTFSGATVTLGTAPAGALINCISARVLAGLTFSGGGATWRIGTQANPTLFATALGTALGGTVSDAQMRVGPTRFGTATPIVATPNTGSFTGGTVVATIHHVTHPAPTG